MELWKPNFIDTTSSIVVNTSSLTAEYVMRPDVRFQWVSSGFNDDTDTVTFRVDFDETTTVDRICLAGINAKEFRLFYNGTTANAFALTTTGSTNTSVWTSNSETSMVLVATPVACTSVTLNIKKTMVADQEKAVGYFVVSENRFTFTRIPAAKNYRPVRQAQEVVHTLSDGLTRVQRVSDFWTAEIQLDYITTAFRNELREIYDMNDGHIFVPFGTTTSWDQVIFPCVWMAPFLFYQFSDNAPSAGFEGSIKLMETTP